jgi:endoglucanase
MKKIACIVFILLFSSTAYLQPVKKHGQLKVAGNGLADMNYQSVVLRGMSFGWHNLWPRFYNAGAVHELVSQWKCTVIRAAMGIELNDSGYLKNPISSQQKIEAVVDAAIKEGVYVIIDWHDHNIHTAEAVVFFSAMAKKYGSYPNVIYEPFNEPDYETWPEVKAYMIEVIKAIRAHDPDNIILVGCPRWDQDINAPANDPIKGYDNLMYTVHFYAATHKQELRTAVDHALHDGLPIFISECAGMEATGDGPLNLEEWQKWIDWMETRRLSWITWSVSDKDETCSVLKKSAASTGGWKDSDLKESGIKAKAYLLKYNVQ